MSRISINRLTEIIRANRTRTHTLEWANNAISDLLDEIDALLVIESSALAKHSPTSARPPARV